MLFFPACSRKRLLAVRTRQCRVYSCASYEVDLPGLFVWCMCLCLCSRTESDARDSITSHNGYAVCGECPFICKWACFSHFFCFSISKTGFTALHDEDAKDLKEALKLDENSNVLVISTEGDTDPVRYREIVWDGLYGTNESLSK